MAASKPKGIGSGRLPELRNLINKGPDELNRTLARFGLDVDTNALYTRANKAFEKLDAILDQGVIPDEAQWEAVDKQIERETAAYLRQQVKTAIQKYRASKFSPDDEMTWIGVGVGMCPSCEPRHGRTKSMREWKRLGLPGSSALVCEKECRCGLHKSEHHIIPRRDEENPE